nr:RyR domain-containing protein [uncultured Draconibacterium sp.]
MPQKQEIPKSLLELLEELAENVHNTWANARIKEGWVYGVTTDHINKIHSCLIPYDELRESEKEYDRNTALETIKFILDKGYSIEKSN